MPRALTSAFASLAAVLLTHAATVAGPLFPPAGPIVSTNKTLTEVEPRIAITLTNTPGDADSVFRISQPGSYYLTQNLVGSPFKSTIEVAADSVTIDLNGFAIVGSPTAIDGISVSIGTKGLSVRNGSIRGHAGSGIFATFATAGNYQDLLLVENGLEGIWPGPASRLERVTAEGNGRKGFDLNSARNSTLVDCIAKDNPQGFTRPDEGVIFERCVARGNFNGNGFELGLSGKAINCIAESNAAAGFIASGFSAIFEGCVAKSNRFKGFESSARTSVFTRCVAIANGDGLNNANGFRITDAATDAEFIECVANENTLSGFEILARRSNLHRCSASSNSGNGVQAAGSVVRCIDSRFENNNGVGLNLGQGSIIEVCAIQKNFDTGIRINGNGNGVIRRTQIVSNSGIGAIIGNGTVVEDCFIVTNQLQGISGGVLTIIRRSTFDTNGTAAGNFHPHISLTGGGNLIEDNYIFNGDSGIAISFGGGSIVRRNICNSTANNYGLIVSGNRVANINTSATLNSTNPNDNFSY